MKKLENGIWTTVNSTIQMEIENCEELLSRPGWENEEYLKKRVSNLKIALKEFETQQLEDLLS